MAGIDAVGKNTYITNQNYNGVKIDIHNPVVNVPQNNGQPAAQPIKIYKYQEAQIPAEYYPQMIKTQKKLPSHTPAALPDPKPAVELPKSVLEERKTIPVPEPVYVTPKTQQTTTPPAETVNIVPAEISVAEAPNAMAQTEPTTVEEEKSEQQPVIISEETTQPQQPVSSTNTAAAAANAAQAPVAEKTEPVSAAHTEIKKIADPDETIHRPISKVEIVPPGDTSPVIDYIQITENLDSPNFDVQALQMKEIVDAGLTNNPKKIRPYLVEPIFHSLIDIVNKDTSKLAGPTDAQNQIRMKIVENMNAYEEQKQAGVPDEKITLPHTISEEDKNYAITLTPVELAERNKDYGISTLALLSKAFLERTEEETGTVLSITDAPGLAAIVNTLNSPNYKTKLSALDALIFLQRAEYARELTPIYEALAKTDPDTTVRAAAQFALENLNSKAAQQQTPAAA